MIDLSSSVLASRRKIVAYWVTAALVVLELTMGGAWDILRVPQVRGLVASGLINVGAMAYPIIMIGVAVASWALRPHLAASVPHLSSFESGLHPKPHSNDWGDEFPVTRYSLDRGSRSCLCD